MSEADITIPDLAKMAVFAAAVGGIEHLHKGKVRELFSPYGCVSVREREFLPFSDAEIIILGDSEALWSELSVILGSGDGRVFGLPLKPSTILSKGWDGLGAKSVGHMLCIIRALHAFGVFPGYR